MFIGDGDRLWDHYAISLQQLDPISGRSCQMGADTVVFMRWFHAQLRTWNLANFDDLWGQIAKFVDLEIYDPIFDQEEWELERSEQILMGMFGVTKKFMENSADQRREEKQTEEENSVYKGWRECVDRVRKKGPDSAKNRAEIMKWMHRLHRKEFGELMGRSQKHRDSFRKSKRRKGKLVRVFQKD